jgi:hypothetical protein
VDGPDIKYWTDRDRVGKVQRKATKNDSGKKGVDVCVQIK